MNYREKTVRLGKTSPLLGILTEPLAGTPTNGRGLVLLNAGLLHRVGPSRLHVQVAREMAPRGFQVLRFDFSGIGDSDARRDGLAFEQSAVLEVQDAMDALAAKGVTDFTLMGLCSGADAAFLAALADPRVTGLVQLDPWIYRTWRFAVHHYLPKLRSRDSWRNLLSGDTLKRLVWQRVFPPREGPHADEVNDNVVVAHYAREFPPRAQVEQQLGALLARGVRFLCLFSGGMPEHISYAGQFRDCFGSLPLGNQVQVHYDATAEHIFSALHHQKMVVDTARDWMLAERAAA